MENYLDLDISIPEDAAALKEINGSLEKQLKSASLKKLI